MGVDMPRKSDKRERLVQSAMDLMFRQGFNLTTLADIAQEADVPLGNVYYYFKTKESIGDAVIAHCLAELNLRLASYSAMPHPNERICAFLDHELQNREQTVRYGDGFGSLCQELAKQGGVLATAAANLLSQPSNWLEKQFIELGYSSNEATSKALSYMAKLQGMNLLAATLNKSEYIESACRELKSELLTAKSSTHHDYREKVEAYA